MTINAKQSNLRNEKWVRRMAELESEHESVGVGGMACDLGVLRASGVKTLGVFGRFVEFSRRRQKMSVEELATRAGVSLVELVAIEQDLDAVPQPMTVHQIAKFLKLPPKPLMELAGLMQARNSPIGTAAVRFAAQSETNAALTPQESLAYDEFVKVIVEASD